MIVEPTAGKSPPDSSADTMMASGAQTLDAPHQVASQRGQGGSRPTTSRMGSVLPEVRSKGETLVLVPRDATRYVHDQLLGRGGMGEVQLATDHDIGRKVAVKRVLAADNPHAVARFIDEIRTVGNLEHPNIVPIHDVGVDDDGALFFVMKYVEGETLADVIGKLAAGDSAYHARYSFEHRLELFAGLLRALKYAHSRGLVHRDIKPENIMVGAFGEVMLMDWGIAHQLDADKRVTLAVSPVPRVAKAAAEGTVVGTPQYMSPEQAAGEVAGLDGRSDLYSAFTVLFELLTLTPYVRPGGSAVQTVLAVQDRTLPGVRDAVFDHSAQPAVAVELRHFLRHGLVPAKDDRFPDAAEALAELERVRAGDFAVECAVTLLKSNNTRLGRFMDEYPSGSLVLAAGTGAAVLLGLAGWVAFALS
ncbi:MAG: serine/threonine-protein kinase [Nannocystales bacterium]